MCPCIEFRFRRPKFSLPNIWKPRIPMKWRRLRWRIPPLVFTLHFMPFKISSYNNVTGTHAARHSVSQSISHARIFSFQEESNLLDPCVWNDVAIQSGLGLSGSLSLSEKTRVFCTFRLLFPSSMRDRISVNAYVTLRQLTTSPRSPCNAFLSQFLFE